jgi:hemerythrin-like metal-binding protein
MSELARFVHYKTNISIIDDDHHNIIVLMNDIVWDLKNNGQADTRKLDNLLINLTKHFKTEEGFMHSIGYPYVDDHTSEHVSILNYYIDTSNCLIGVFNQLNFIDVLEEIVVGHIDNYDLPFADYYKRVKQYKGES